MHSIENTASLIGKVQIPCLGRYPLNQNTSRFAFFELLAVRNAVDPKKFCIKFYDYEVPGTFVEWHSLRSLFRLIFSFSKRRSYLPDEGDDDLFQILIKRRTSLSSKDGFHQLSGNESMKHEDEWISIVNCLDDLEKCSIQPPPSFSSVRIHSSGCILFSRERGFRTAKEFVSLSGSIGKLRNLILPILDTTSEAIFVPKLPLYEKITTTHQTLKQDHIVEYTVSPSETLHHPVKKKMNKRSLSPRKEKKKNKTASYETGPKKSKSHTKLETRSDSETENSGSDDDWQSENLNRFFHPSSSHSEKHKNQKTRKPITERTRKSDSKQEDDKIPTIGLSEEDQDVLDKLLKKNPFLLATTRLGDSFGVPSKDKLLVGSTHYGFPEPLKSTEKNRKRPSKKHTKPSQKQLRLTNAKTCTEKERHDDDDDDNDDDGLYGDKISYIAQRLLTPIRITVVFNNIKDNGGGKLVTKTDSVSYAIASACRIPIYEERICCVTGHRSPSAKNGNIYEYMCLKVQDEDTGCSQLLPTSAWIKETSENIYEILMCGLYCKKAGLPKPKSMSWITSLRNDDDDFPKQKKVICDHDSLIEFFRIHPSSEDVLQHWKRISHVGRSSTTEGISQSDPNIEKKQEISTNCAVEDDNDDEQLESLPQDRLSVLRMLNDRIFWRSILSSLSVFLYKRWSVVPFESISLYQDDFCIRLKTVSMLRIRCFMKLMGMT